MTHEDALNKILSHSCSNPAYYPDDKRTHEYKIRLCCREVKIIAVPIRNGRHEIVSVEVTD